MTIHVRCWAEQLLTELCVSISVSSGRQHVALCLLHAACRLCHVAHDSSVGDSIPCHMFRPLFLPFCKTGQMPWAASSSSLCRGLGKRVWGPCNIKRGAWEGRSLTGVVDTAEPLWNLPPVTGGEQWGFELSPFHDWYFLLVGGDGGSSPFIKQSCRRLAGSHPRPCQVPAVFCATFSHFEPAVFLV